MWWGACGACPPMATLALRVLLVRWFRDVAEATFALPGWGCPRRAWCRTWGGVAGFVAWPSRRGDDPPVLTIPRWASTVADPCASQRPPEGVYRDPCRAGHDSCRSTPPAGSETEPKRHRIGTEGMHPATTEQHQPLRGAHPQVQHHRGAPDPARNRHATQRTQPRGFARSANSHTPPISRATSINHPTPQAHRPSAS